MQELERGQNYWPKYRKMLTVTLAVFVVMIIFLNTLPTKAAVITEWNVPSGIGSYPQFLVVDDSSNVWFTEFGSDRIGKLTYGTFTEYSLPAGSRPIGIDFSGDVWFTESVTNRIARLTIGGSLTEYLVGDPPYGAMNLWGISIQNQTRIWFTSSQMNRVGLLNRTTDDSKIQVKYWILPGFDQSPSSNPRGIVYSLVTGAWFVDYNLNRIGNIPDPFTSQVREWQLPDYSHPFDIDLDSDGNVWFTESGRNRIGMLDPLSNRITEYSIPTQSGEPYGVAVDYSNRVWFAEHAANKIGRFTPGINTTTEFSRPASGAPYGITADKDGAPPIWFSDGTSGKIGKLSPYEGLTTSIGSSLSRASTSSMTSYPSTYTLKTDVTTGWYSSSITTTMPLASATQTGTTSTQYTVTERMTQVQTSISQATTLFSTTTGTTTVSTTVTVPPTGYGYFATTTTDTLSKTETTTETSYVDTISLTSTSTQTATTTETTYVVTMGQAIPGYSTPSILVGLSLGATFLILCRKMRCKTGPNARS